MPKRTSLPSMLPPVEAERVERGVAVALRPSRRRDAGEEQHDHRGEDRPALALVADHPAERVGQRRADREDREHLHEVGERGRVLERMRGVGVEEAAAVGAEHLDRFLRGDRAQRDGLLGALQRGRVGIGAERLRHALRDQEQRGDARRSAAGYTACSGSDRPRNCRWSAPSARAKPRISAMASAMPVAADRKL